MARRTKRRATSTARKRPSTRPVARPPVQQSGAAEPEAVIPEQEGSSTPEPVARPSRGSFLPRRQAGPAPAAAASSSSPPPSASAAAVGERPAGPASFLPAKGRITGRAERQRQQQAHLEQLDDSSAVPTDRTPYLWLDLRRVIWVCAIMVVMVIVGFFVLR
ncbi:MAG TPA: hypothetical protein VNH38_08255 [Candidatus Dormibacteraeota bacterium]|nr:hypothetical protein [Candidatus Dormibacteraeota bacterium]